MIVEIDRQILNNQNWQDHQDLLDTQNGKDSHQKNCATYRIRPALQSCFYKSYFQEGNIE